MYKQKQYLAPVVKKQIGFAGFLFAIMLFLPQYAFADEVIVFGDDSTESQQIGSATGARMWAWPFTPTIDSTEIEVSSCIDSVGSNTDGVIVEIMADDSGAPDSVLGSLTIPFGDLDCGSGDPAVNYGSVSGLSISNGTQYWVGFRRTDFGQNSDTNRYLIYGDYPGTRDAWVVLTNSWADAFQGDDRDFNGNLNILVVDDGGGGSATTTVQYVDNPTLDLFMGMILFLVMMWGTIFWFKRNK